jgi:hypothetical protein
MEIQGRDGRPHPPPNTVNVNVDSSDFGRSQGDLSQDRRALFLVLHNAIRAFSF